MAFVTIHELWLHSLRVTMTAVTGSVLLLNIELSSLLSKHSGNNQQACSIILLLLFCALSYRTQNVHAQNIRF